MEDWLIVFITLCFSSFFSGIEIAFVSSNRLKIEVDKNKGSFAARLISYFNRIPSRFIGALLLGNMIALVIYGITMARILDPFIRAQIPHAIHHESLVLVIQAFIATALLLVTGEFIPKVIFRIEPNKTLIFFAVPLTIFYYFFYPFVYAYTAFSEFVLQQLTSTKLKSDTSYFTVVDLGHYVKEFLPETKNQGDVNQELQMFQNAIDFRNVKLRECMVPRTEILAFDENESIDNLRQAFIESGHSKIPVFRDTIDHVIGYTHSADIFKNPPDIKSIIRSIHVVPESMPANLALSMLIQHNRSIALVVDEFGGTSGMVTIEDVIEEIFGEIEDEFDVEELTEKMISDQEYIFSARLEIDYLNEKYLLDLPKSEEYETLAGLIIHFHESIPLQNDRIEIGSFVFVILEASEIKIEKVKLFREIDNLIY